MNKTYKINATSRKKMSNAMKESWKKRKAVKELAPKNNAPVITRWSEPVKVKSEPDWKVIAIELLKTQLA